MKSRVQVCIMNTLKTAISEMWGLGGYTFLPLDLAPNINCEYSSTHIKRLERNKEIINYH